MAVKKIERILVVVHNRDDGEIVLEKARRLAGKDHARLFVTRVIHEAFAELSVHAVDKSQALKTAMLQAEEAFLEDLVDPLRDELEIETTAVWNKSVWQGVLDMATDCDAQFIVKGSDEPDTGMARTPSDWHLLRHANVPVMLVKPAAWRAHPVVMAAVNTGGGEDTDLNLRILNRARQLADLLQGELQVVSVFPAVEHWVGPVTLVVDFDQVRRTVNHAMQDQIGKLLAEDGTGAARVHTPDGMVDTMIARTLAATETEVLVLGTHQRESLRGIVMGNTSEKILHKVHCDVEVLR